MDIRDTVIEVFQAYAEKLASKSKGLDVVSDADLEKARRMASNAYMIFHPVTLAADRLATQASYERDRRIRLDPDQQLKFIQSLGEEQRKRQEERGRTTVCVVCGIQEKDLDETEGGTFSLSVNFHGSKQDLNPGWTSQVPLLCRDCADKMPAPWNRLLAYPETFVVSTRKEA